MPSILDDPVTVNGLAFNIGGVASRGFGCDLLVGWDDTPGLNVVIEENNYFDGGSALDGAAHMTKQVDMGGWINGVDRDDVELKWRQLLAALYPGIELQLLRTEGTLTRQMKVRLVSGIAVTQDLGTARRWIASLRAVDPFKYSQIPSQFTSALQVPGLFGRAYGTTVRTNGITNPSMEVDTTGWTANGGATLSRVTSQFLFGIASLQIVTTATANSGCQSNTVTAGAGETWTAKVALRGNAGGEVVNIELLNQAGVAVGAQKFGVNLTTAWQEFGLTGVTPAGTTSVSLRINRVSAVAQTYFLDKAIIERSPGGPYFDGTGGEVGDNFTFAWTGTAHASTSTATRAESGRLYDLVYVDSGNDEGVGITDTINFVNYGDYVSYPSSVVQGPLASGWSLYNTTTGEFLQFDIDVLAGQTVVIDHANHSAILDSVPIEYTQRGSWWGLAPGLNVLRMMAPDYNTTARWNLTAYSRWR